MLSSAFRRAQLAEESGVAAETGREVGAPSPACSWKRQGTAFSSLTGHAFPEARRVSTGLDKARCARS
jgi:hypothetical protein